ncbi:E3 ubiquitin-protein ligase TRIM39-like [Danio aesculapii]|uniref:E3 ubiquitin-protein ligase TRIM39-like n=1 Tax=Danio aesculapii TaxID=1142201 RepID=UPI0024C05C4A|nr:E3 ubiquitin-protein ligase TRIM39-like [Danio aesculapii]
MDSASAEDLTCPVCKGNFKDPFVLTCKHRYCTECLRSLWRDTETKTCPLCRRQSSLELPPDMCILHNVKLQLFCVEDQQYVCLTCVNSEEHTNHTFRSIKRGISSLKETKERSSTESETICSLHNEKLQLFCQEDEQPVCVDCVYAETHTNHSFKSISEAVSTYKEKLKTEMKTLEEDRKHKENLKGEFEESAKHIKVKVDHTEKQIEHQFEALRQKLEEEKQAVIAALREEEEKMMKKTVEEIDSQISTLTDAIKDTEEMLKVSDDCLLKEADVLRKRVQISQLDPELPSAASINVSQYMWNLMSNIKKKMEETINNIFQYTPVLLDPKTAHSDLVVSEDLTSVKREKSPDDKKKPYHPYVLGSEGYTSGKHSWDVEVKDSKFWTIGVMAESNHKKGGDIFTSDNWSVHYDSYSMSTWAGFSVCQHLECVRVELDYDNGTVSFSDPVKNTLLHTFTTTFTETVFPFFHTLDSLKILRSSDE